MPSFERLHLVSLQAILFNVSCIRGFFQNSRPTKTRNSTYYEPQYGAAARNGSVLAPLDEDPFADPYDMQTWRWAKARFKSDLSRYGVTRERCASEVCPEAASYFIDTAR